MLVRFIAVSLMGVTLVNWALYWVVAQHNHTAMNIFSCVLKSIPAVIGLVLFDQGQSPRGVDFKQAGRMSVKPR